MKGGVSQDKSIIFWAGLVAVTFAASGCLLHADDTPASSDGDRVVPVSVGGHTVPLKVRDNNPFKNFTTHNSSDKYDPQAFNFSAASPMANKKFDVPVNSFSQSDTNGQHQIFFTKPYHDDSGAPTVPNLNNKADFSKSSDFNKSNSDFNKTYATSQADAGQDRTALLAKSDSEDQNRTAVLNSKPIDTPASTLGDKTFQGQEADDAHRRLTKTDDGKMAVSDLPDRPLTIDEVKNLINHGFKPNTEAKPETPSKPLNDPAHEPEPLRESPTPVSDDDKNDPVPPPGTMAAPQPPENAEPLPKP